MANTITNSLVSADSAGALIRTSLSKSGSCKTLKSKATSDARLVDAVRGNKFEINSLVMLQGIVSVDVNTEMGQRVDRIKLFGQAVVNILRGNQIVNRDNLIAEMQKLYGWHAANIDVKQPDAETFDGMIAEILGNQEVVDRLKTPIRTVNKAGDFSVSELQLTILGSECAEQGVGGKVMSIDNASESVIAAARRLLKGSGDKKITPVGNITTPSGQQAIDGKIAVKARKKR